jgi:hypothetical protein
MSGTVRLGSERTSYSLFHQTAVLVNIVETIYGWERAIRMLRNCSLNKHGKFVLFDQVNVVAVGQDGVIEFVDQDRPQNLVKRIGTWVPRKPNQLQPGAGDLRRLGKSIDGTGRPRTSYSLDTPAEDRRRGI